MRSRSWFAACATVLAFTLLGTVTKDARAGAQAGRQQYGASAQASRQQAYEDAHWDEGKGLAIAATGAVVGRAAGAMTSAAATSAAPPPPPPAAAPCSNPTLVPVGDVTYSQCGSTWYTQAYGASGPVYVQSAPPPGS